MKTPNIPQNAPYSDTQRAWLGGFFAGMHSHMLQSSSTINQADARIINILYGTQTGNSESVANDAAAVAKTHGLLPVVKSMDEIELDALVEMGAQKLKKANISINKALEINPDDQEYESLKNLIEQRKN